MPDTGRKTILWCLGCGQDLRLRYPVWEARARLEAASTGALRQACQSAATIVLLAELHYTTPNFQAMGT
jgi:hypothetical protein